jgi:hypothetical protein
MNIKMTSKGKGRKDHEGVSQSGRMGDAKKQLLKSGWKKKSIEEGLYEKSYTPKMVKQAIGIASDDRYAGGNMTGATRAIEKLAKGLSNYPQVKAVLKRQNEELDESVYDKKLTQAWKKLLSVPNVRGISNSGQNHAKKLSSLLKGSPDNLTFEKLELALGTYETHAYKAAEDKKNPHGKEDLAKLEEFSNSVDDVIGAMKNLHQSQLPEGFLDTFLGRNMKKGNVDKKKSKKSKNSEQVKLSTEIDRKLRLIDDLMKKVRPLGGNLGRLMAFRKLPIDKMTPKGMYVALNDWWDSVEADLDDDSEDDNEKYAQSAEKLYDLWEEVGFKLSDYMWASGYNVKGIGQMAKIGFPAKKRTDAEWLKMSESVDLDESVYDKKLAQAWKKVKSMPNVRGISNSGQNHAKKLSALLKGSPDKLTFEKLELALGNYETHAYKIAEDKKNPHGKEDLAKLEEFSNSVDDVIGAMKNLHQSQLPEGFMDTMKQLVPGAKGKPQKPRKGQKTAMEMQFPYARLSVHRMIEALRKATKVERRFNAKDLSFMLDVVEEIARTRHGEQPNSGMAIHDVMNIDDVTQSYFMNKIAQNDWKKTDQAILDAMVGNGTDDYTKGGAYVKNLAHDIALSVKYAKKDAGIKESVELDEKAPKIDPKKYAAHMDRNKKKKTISSTKKNLSDISKRADKMSRESVELDELSPKTKKSYKNKATRSIGNEKKYSDSYSDASKADPDNPTYKSRADQHKRKLKNRISGVAKADESALDELSMTKADLTKTGMRVDSKKMAELKKELMKLKKGLKVKMEQYIAESVYFEDETMEMVARDLMIMQNKILDLVEIMDDNGMGGVDSQPISLEPWVVAKITKAKDYLDSIHDYTVMDNENE